MTDRPAARLSRGRRALPTISVAGLLLLSGCALPEDNDYPHRGDFAGWTDGSVVRTVLLYVVLPLALLALLYALSVLPEARRRHRYRPAEGWDAEPVWFAGPADPVAAVEQAQTGDVVRGGAGGSW